MPYKICMLSNLFFIFLKALRISKNLFIFWGLLVGLTHLSLATSKEKFIGVSNAYRFPSGNAIIIEFPLEFSGLLFNQNQARDFFLPKRFVLSDGSSQRPFIEVDYREGSQLFQKIQKIATEISLETKINLPRSRTSTRLSFNGFYRDYFLREALDVKKQEVILSYLAMNIQKYLNWPNEVLSIPPSLALQSHQDDLKKLELGKWIETEFKNPVQDFSEILDSKKGVCLDMVILTSLLLDQFNIPHHVIFGSVISDGEKGSGHTWIQLQDQRVLDVAWNTLSKPEVFRNDGSFLFGNERGKSYRFSYSFFPIIKF